MRNLFSKDNRRWLLPLIFVAAAICCAAALFWYLPRPKGAWQEKRFVIYEGIDGVLTKKRFRIINGKGETTYKSDTGFLVQDAFSTDLDRDGEKEIILLLWKIGKYGKHRPFWVERDEITFSQHVFIYSVSVSGGIRHRWGASEIGREIARMKLMEKNDSLILTEDVNGNCAVWRWESFGLKTIDSDVSFAVFGDNIIHSQIYEYADRKMNGCYDFLYEPFYEDIQSVDIAAFQQETMLVDKASAVSGYPMFGSPVAVGEAIAKAGFDIASCAGNHALDRGIYGINVTTKFYRDKGIICLGVQSGDESAFRPYEILTKNGISFALFDYTYGTGEMDISKDYPFAVHYLPRNSSEEETLVRDLRSARAEADFVIVFVHWGNEYESDVTSDQKHMTQLFAEGGADAVIGTHPHVLQETEMMKRPDGGDMLIYYSLGNFRAYQGQTEETKTGGEALFTVEHSYDGVRIKDFELKKIDAMVKTGY